MNKGKSGITMVTLVVTIVVLIILSMISINALVGENGIISRAIESRIVSILADIIFDIESNIVDINADNLVSNTKYTASETLNSLREKNILEMEDKFEEEEEFPDIGDDGFDSDDPSNFENVLNVGYYINDERIKHLTLGFNGDIWLDNYKRGKIQLSSNYNVLYSQPTGKTKITVIDGTAEQIDSDGDGELDEYKYYLHSLKERNDFICWINQYGEVISYEPDTIVYITNPREEEYTAVYNNEFKNSGFGHSCSDIDYCCLAYLTDNFAYSPVYLDEYYDLPDIDYFKKYSATAVQNDDGEVFIECQGNGISYPAIYANDDTYDDINFDGYYCGGSATVGMALTISSDLEELEKTSGFVFLLDDLGLGEITEDLECSENAKVFLFYGIEDTKENDDINGQKYWDENCFFESNNYLDEDIPDDLFKNEKDYNWIGLTEEGLFNVIRESELRFLSTNVYICKNITDEINELRNKGASRIYYKLDVIDVPIYIKYDAYSGSDEEIYYYDYEPDEGIFVDLSQFNYSGSSTIKYIDI